MRHVRVHDRLLVLDADDLADDSRVKRLLQRAEVRRIAQDVPHRHHYARLALARKEVHALLRRLRHRLLQQDVVPLPHRLHRRLVVERVRKRDDHDVRQLPAASGRQHLAEVAEAALGRNAPPVAHRVAARGVRVRDRDDPHRAWVELPVCGVLVAARARAHDGDGDLAGGLYLKRLHFAEEIFVHLLSDLSGLMVHVKGSSCAPSGGGPATRSASPVRRSRTVLFCIAWFIA